MAQHNEFERFKVRKNHIIKGFLGLKFKLFPCSRYFQNHRRWDADYTQGCKCTDFRLILEESGFVKAAQFAGMQAFQWHFAQGFHGFDADLQVAGHLSAIEF